MLAITNLHATTDQKEILRGIQLAIPAGSTIALLGPNGSGKSTLAQVLMGHPDYHVTQGQVEFNGVDLLALKPEARAHAGLFLAFQYPPVIAGVSIANFLRLAYNETHAEKLSVPAFIALLKQKMDLLKLPHEFMARSVNEGFSGGEKKRAEMLQLAVLEPKLAILDETDSGLDVDALKIVGHALQKIRTVNPTMSLLVITHHQRILDFIPPHRVTILHEGKIIREGGPEILASIATHGFARNTA